MKALGKGSVASIVQVGLIIIWWALAVMIAIWTLIALAYTFFMVMVGLTAIDPASIPAPDQSGGDGVQLQVSGIDPAALADLKWTDWHIVGPVLFIVGMALGGSLIIVGRLRRLFASFTSGDPFRRENAQHLRVIWITMVVIELSRYVLMAIVGLALGVFGAPESVGHASFVIDSDNFSNWMPILILIVLAEVFREGARLKEEQELTI